MSAIGHIHHDPQGTTLNGGGLLAYNAILEIDGSTYPIPATTEAHGTYAPARIQAALESAGYRTDGDFHDALGPLVNGVREIRVVKA